MPFRRSGQGPLTGRHMEVAPGELSWPLDNGRVCLDLVATVGERWGRCFERLRTPDDLCRWLDDAELLSTARATATDLEHARRLRSAVYACVEAALDGRDLPQSACRVLNASASQPEPAPHLGRVRTVRWLSNDPVGAALSLVARDAITLISGPYLARVRECAAEDCSRVFLDRSRPGSRRWCSMQTCGNRAKAERHRARTSDGEPSARASDEGAGD